MNNLVCFITGTNAVGKSTLARQLIETFGGVERVTDKITYCKDGETCFLGKYFYGGKFEGVDTYPTTNGLYKHVQAALSERNVVFAEGFYLHTFGLNLQKALLQGQRQMIVFLYAPSKVLNNRLLNRGGRGVTKFVINTQRGAFNAAKRWHEIGIPVLSFDTSKYSVSEIEQKILERINKL